MHARVSYIRLSEPLEKSACSIPMINIPMCEQIYLIKKICGVAYCASCIILLDRYLFG